MSTPQQPEFPIIETTVAAVIPEDDGAFPCKWPFFVVAYWPRGKYWSVKSDLYAIPDSDGIKTKTAELRSRGWTHIHVCKLPL